MRNSGSAIKTDLSDIARLGQKAVEKSQLILPLMGQLWMQAERRSDASERAASADVPFHAEGVVVTDSTYKPRRSHSSRHRLRVGIQVEMAMKIDHLTP